MVRDYDSVTNEGPSENIKERLFQSFIAPYLRQEPNPSELGYFYQASWNAWLLSIKTADQKTMLFMEWICEQLLQKNENELAELISEIFQENFNEYEQNELCERDAYNAKLTNDYGRIFHSLLVQYKSLFERSLRIWSSVPYFYACKNLEIKYKAGDVREFVHVSSGEKLSALKNITTPLPEGDIRDFIIGFDNEVRNAGAGHDSWEITDKNTLILNIRDPKKGSLKGSQKIELSESQLEDMIKKCRKTLWMLENGLLIFLNNNPSFEKLLISKKEANLREVKNSVESFSMERWLRVEKFEWTEDKNNISIELKYRPKIVGRMGELLFGNGEKYDLINIVSNVDYEKQILGIIQFMIATYFSKDKVPNVSIKVFDKDGKEIGDVEYLSAELIKLYEKKELPIPKKGKLPDGKYDLISAVRVPAGMRDVMEKILKEKGYNCM